MFGKRRTLALAIATAGLIGMSATMASAAEGPGGGDFGGLLNVSHNQVPIQLCNDTVPVNVIGGQVPLQSVVVALGLANPGNTTAQTNSSCHQGAFEADSNGHGDEMCRDCDPNSTMVSDGGPMTRIEQHGEPGGDFGGLVNVSGNEIPIQLCNDTVPVNVIGVQVPLQNVAAALGLLSPGNTNAQQDSSCHQGTAQVNNNG